jgi:hypothetical protein
LNRGTTNRGAVGRRELTADAAAAGPWLLLLEKNVELQLIYTLYLLLLCAVF